ncbi:MULTISPECIES: hypothetical protein [Alphaproteobacteria]|jgi:hypothetical protein|uniref:hypothetical protein n=1 Tax=Alphaproteobacteria TaxID=28211 RepID=UPI00065F3B5F|nr:hypothetical protein [Aurantiacibacter atlanticus]|tara:strand:- start:786 stop:1208 length:423 start_codon:yes stop_codon:yes gene_type:complete
MRIAGLIPIFILVAGCSTEVTPDTSPVLQENQKVAQAESVFIGRRVEDRETPYAALFTGEYAIRSGCLVFAGGGEAVYLAVFSEATDVAITQTGITIDGSKEIAFGTPLSIGGGVVPTNAVTLRNAVPADCDYELLLVGG